MPRNGSGSYNLPAGNPVITGAAISSTVHNNTMTDMADALTASLSKDGQTLPTANLPMAGFRHLDVDDAAQRTQYATAAQVQDSSLTYLTSVAGVDTITASTSIGIYAYAAGQVFTFVSAGGNTGAVTLNINALGAKAVTKNGANPLSAGDIPSGSVVQVGYDGTRFQLVGNMGSAPSGYNLIHNGNFQINQRAVSGTVTLAAGAYGHDRWKAGASGCTYTFATTENLTTLTITAGTLQQVIEGLNLQSGTHTLSWSGTAQGRIDSGSYGASGITGTAVGGTNQTVEFGTGTLAIVQYEAGDKATSFEYRPYDVELEKCQRYLPVIAPGTAAFATGYNGTSVAGICIVPFRVPPRIPPTGVSVSSAAHFQAADGANSYVWQAVAFSSASIHAARIVATIAGATAYRPTEISGNNASAKLIFTGCEL